MQQRVKLAGILAALLFVTNSFSQADVPSEPDETKLAKKTQNPVGDLISLPFQNNTSFGVGFFDRNMNVLNIHPVVPVRINEDWNMITRTILPVITRPTFLSNTDYLTGLGDLSVTAFFSPINDKTFTWGVGPVFYFPIATNPSLGTGKWSAGPSIVALTLKGQWVAGILMSNVWSFAGDEERLDVNSFLLQYFVNYNFNRGWYLVSAPIITSNWNAPDGEGWIVPFGAGGGKVFKLGKQPMNANFQVFKNVVTPTYGPEWSIRFQIQLMFPK